MQFSLLTTWSRQIVTFITVCAVFTAGVPIEKPRPTAPQWTTHNMSLWEDVVLLSSDSDHQPLLMINQTGVYTAPDIEKMENETLRKFHILKANYTKYFYDTDGGKNKEDSRSSRAALPGFVDKALQLLNLNQVVGEVETSVMSKMSCTACKAGAGLLQHYIKHGKTRDDIVKITYQFCTSFKLQTPRVCEGITELFSGEVVYVLQRINIGPEEICSFVIGDACGDVYNPTHEWDVVFPPVPKPTPNEIKILKEPVPQFKVLHLSDTHFDPYYEEGTNADCNEPLCCRLTNGPAVSPQNRAGRWGDYRKCDTPKRTIDNMLQHIVSTHTDIDYIIWTGDLPAHDIWNQTKEENLSILKETVAQLLKMFPGIPIFPALGNHEAVPVNSFPPSSLVNKPEYAIDWLYSELDTQWRRWLPGSVSRTIKRGAFYSVLVRPGFRIISLNMNYCNNKNWWLLMNSTDPVKELQWFIYELQNAEFNGEKVHVLGHIPPGHPDCLKVWSRNYYAIISRYESTITAQFFGHTHFDEFELFYDTQDLGRPVSIAYVGPSVTPYYDLNPGYRIYYVDGDREHSTRAVLDHETWVMNLKEANLYDYPIWQKLYSTQAAYSLPSLRPEDWDVFVNNLAEDQTLFDLYYKHYWKNSPTRPACDAECKKRMICDLRSGRSHDRKILCQEIESRIDAGSRISWSAWLYNGFTASIVTMSTMESKYNTNISDPNLSLPLETADPELYALVSQESQRQRKGLELIASENFTSVSVLQCLGSCLTNKYSEGLPGARYYGGNQVIDQIEVLCQKRCLETFSLDPNLWGVNVQPYSGSPANVEAYTALIGGSKGRIMGLDLPDGGHISHGLMAQKKRLSAASIFFETLPYHVNMETGLIDYDELEKSAKNFKPDIIIAGVTSYPRTLDYKRFRTIAQASDSYLMADMSHISGLVAAGVIPSPFEYCDVVTSTTHKTLRGPRAGVIFYRKGVKSVSKTGENVMYDLEDRVNAAVFPGFQGGPHNNAIAGIAAAMRLATTQEFKNYQKRVLSNCKQLAESLKQLGYKISTDGTDVHMLLVDLRPINLTGSKAEFTLQTVEIACNKNTVPGDKSAMNPYGIRLGTPALTTRGMVEKDIVKVAELIHKGLNLALDAQKVSGPKLVNFKSTLTSDPVFVERVKDITKEVEDFAEQFYIPEQ